MRIAQVAPPWLPLPPAKHGGTELVVATLTEQLRAAGHQVTLFAPAGSVTSATLVPTPARPAGVEAMGSPHFERAQVAEVSRHLGEFDVVHVHTPEQARQAARLPVPVLLTLHDPPSPELAPLAGSIDLVPPSRCYAESAGQLPLAPPIHHGIDVTRYRFTARKENFLLFMGRMVPEKGLHRAIGAARQAGLPLVAVAVRSGFAREERYFAEVIRPLLGPEVTLLDQVGFERKVELMRWASGLLFPIEWDEPFGLVMIEAMACGTPVIGTAQASVPEIVRPGTGVILPVESFGQACRELTGMLAGIDPADCRRHVEGNFDSALMARRYAAAYRKAIDEGAA
jgi:glycosyltransferase involved in cell wall biosynthesis